MSQGQQQFNRMNRTWLIFVVILSLMLVFYPQKTAQAAGSSCQCVDYVRHRFNLTGNSGYAMNFGSFLQAKGFTQSSTPRVGAVAVMQPAFGQGVSTAGHVSVITAVKSVGKYWQITTIGANQSRKRSAQYNCSNVGTVLWGRYPKSWGANRITYWISPQ